MDFIDGWLFVLTCQNNELTVVFLCILLLTVQMSELILTNHTKMIVERCLFNAFPPPHHFHPMTFLHPNQSLEPYIIFVLITD